jgi:hypothetical protein
LNLQLELCGTEQTAQRIKSDMLRYLLKIGVNAKIEMDTSLGIDVLQTQKLLRIRSDLRQR